MADEGSTQLMAELVMMEKEEEAKLAAIQAQLDVHEPRLAKARALIMKAKAKYDEVKVVIDPLESDKILIQGELDALARKKAECRMEARRVEVGGIRPGTAEFVEQLNAVAGDPEVAKAKAADKALSVEAELAALKAKMGGGEG
jgi:hypothetical protein